MRAILDMREFYRMVMCAASQIREVSTISLISILQIRTKLFQCPIYFTSMASDTDNEDCHP